MKRKTWKASPALVLPAALILLQLALPACGGGGDSGKESGGKPAITEEDVQREVGEALDTTKEYLQKKGAELMAGYEDRMAGTEKEIEELLRKAEEAGERGIEKAGESLELLRRKQEDARARYDEFRESGASFKDEAARRLDGALKELEQAYRKALASLEGSQGREGK